MNAAVDLFATTPIGNVPPYGTLSAGDEAALYINDYPSWCAYVAPNAAAKFARNGIGALRAGWPCMGPEYRAAVWSHFTPEQQQRLRNAGIDPPVPP